VTNDVDTLRACLDKLIVLADLPAQFPPEERARVAEAIEQVSLALQAIAYAQQAADEADLRVEKAKKAVERITLQHRKR
jgi:hypothetical protein